MSSFRLGLLALPLLVAPLAASAQSWEWNVHEGTSTRHSFGRTIANGDNEGFLSGAQVPAQDAIGWSYAGRGPVLNWSGPGGTPCRSQANYTYFETFVQPEPGMGYEIHFASVDDAARVSVTAGTGTINLPEYVGLREAKTLDLTPFLEAGMINRVVITLADVCGAGNGIRAELRAVPGEEMGGDMDDRDIAAGAPAAAQGFPSGPFRLQTQWRGDGECLEANGPDSPVHGGASFMDRCQNVSGQVWTATSIGDGFFVLRSPLYGDDRCLESNWTESPAHGGAAFMDTCQNVTGQQWRAIPAGDGFFRLQSRFRGTDECFEGNAGDSPAHGGAAFMDRCQNVSGQLWRFVSL